MNVGACKKYGLDTMGSNKGSYHFYWRSLSNLYSANVCVKFSLCSVKYKWGVLLTVKRKWLRCSAELLFNPSFDIL